MVGVVALGEAERLGNVEGIHARREKQQAELRVADLQKELDVAADRVRKLERELMVSRKEAKKSQSRILKLEADNADLKVVVPGLERDVVDKFRASEEYA